MAGRHSQLAEGVGWETGHFVQHRIQFLYSMLMRYGPPAKSRHRPVLDIGLGTYKLSVTFVAQRVGAHCRTYRDVCVAT